MLTISNLSFYFGGRPIFDGANLQIKPKDKIGLIGLNGMGKSTLLRLIVGEYQADAGSISKAGDCSIGFLNQDLLSYQTQDSILQVAMQAFERENYLQLEIDKVLHEMEVNYKDELVDRLGLLQEEFDHLGGYTIQSKAEEILEGLGFKTEELSKPLKEFSGGWRMRVMLAKLLLQKPALLLLDEPTNHLDLPSIQWLENYLTTYEGAFIIVSHDRYFLDAVIDTTIEVSGGKLNVYAGNYSFYLEEKALRNEIQQGAYENQQAKIRQTERFIERFKAKASKARQVQSRVKSLQRLDVVDAVDDHVARIHFKFKFSQPSGKQVIHLDHVSKAYGEKVILKNTTAFMERGDKIALIGANGKGKSTLLRIVSGNEKIEGKSEMGYNVRLAFYAQHQLESLGLENNLIDELKQAGSQKTEAELRTLLGSFLFSNDEVFKKIKVLSGGEKSRVALAKTLLSDANFLLLDEPTNHLDITSVNILIRALQDYEGSFIVVSHDRFFVSSIANKIWYIEDHQLKEYPGTYEEYEYWQSQNEGKNEPPPVKKTLEVKPVKTLTESEKADNQKKAKTLQKDIDALENQIFELETEAESLENQMADSSVYSDFNALAALQTKHQACKSQLNELNRQWEKLAVALELVK